MRFGDTLRKIAGLSWDVELSYQGMLAKDVFAAAMGQMRGCAELGYTRYCVGRGLGETFCRMMMEIAAGEGIRTEIKDDHLWLAWGDEE